MTGNPDISVIVPVYNMEKYLTHCISSILTQSHRNYELILVDDGSTDYSPVMCEELAIQDNRIRVVHKNNMGPGAARNTGIDASAGKYIMFVDADDYILPGMFEKLLNVAEKENTDFMCSSVKKDYGNSIAVDQMDDYIKFTDIICDITLEKQRNFMYMFATGGRNGTVAGKLFSSEFININDLHFEEDIYSEDMIHNLAACISAKRVGAISDVFYIYYDRPGSRVYSLNTLEIKKSSDRVWNLYLGYSGVSINEVRAFGAIRIISSMLFNLKNNNMSADAKCQVVERFITEKGLREYFAMAENESVFQEYADVTGMSSEYASNFFLFIKSLRSFEDILAWQKHYAGIEGKRR